MSIIAGSAISTQYSGFHRYWGQSPDIPYLKSFFEWSRLHVLKVHLIGAIYVLQIIEQTHRLNSDDYFTTIKRI